MKLVTTLLILVVALVSDGAAADDGREPADIARLLEKIRAKYSVPSLAVAVVFDGKIVATNAVGVRKEGDSEHVTPGDKYHLGSITKSMTATVAAMLVERGKISWSTTVGEVFPELKDQMNPKYRSVTLEQFLSQRSGAPHEAPPDLWREAWAAKGTPSEQRLAFVKGVLSRQPEADPGTKYIYSNQGYAIAGVMLERTAGKPWEDLLRTMLFEPLGMTSAGFGAPATEGKVDQPWGHTSKLFSGSKPVPPGPGADNPLAISPAGAVHCSMEDLAKYVSFHMAGERGESKLLKAETFKKLHTAVGDGDYALGWVVLNRKWAHGRTLYHNGSNTTFYAVIWAAPNRDCAIVVATNTGAAKADEACDDAATQVAALWGF
jgi:CubicO group peptidase (beta-lactamase class C family)